MQDSAGAPCRTDWIANNYSRREAKARNYSGSIRIAAPVGQARTQAGPELNSLHISHFTAFLGMFLSFACFSVPGSVPMPNSIHNDRLGLLRLGFTGAI